LRQASTAAAGAAVEHSDVLKVDLHLHTGDDPLDRILHSGRDLVDRASTLGFGALAITLHDALFDAGRLAAYAHERGIVLIPGVERTIRGRHVLLLNFPASAVERVRSLDDLAGLRASGDGLVIAPHPFFPDRSCLGAALDAYGHLFDAVEWSYFWTRQFDFNSRAARWARTNGKPLVGNSDMHDLRQLGRTHSLVQADAHADAICAAVRDGRVRVSTEPVPVTELALVLGGMTLRHRFLPARPLDAERRAPAFARASLTRATAPPQSGR
jgi:predicted metal-dependent phosphoesterase TrpH